MEDNKLMKYLVYLKGNTSPQESYGEDYVIYYGKFDTEKEAEDFIISYQFNYGETEMFYVRGKTKYQ